MFELIGDAKISEWLADKYKDGRKIELGGFIHNCLQAQLDDINNRQYPEAMKKLKAKLEYLCPHPDGLNHSNKASCATCWEAVWKEVLNG